MMTRTPWPVVMIGAVCTLGAVRAVADPPAAVTAKPARTRIALAQPLPAMDGGHLTARIVEVTYEPGGASAPHSHPCPVMVYVIEGAVRMQVKGQPEAIYRAGQTFFEAANGIHQVSANASNQAPAKFVAIAVCDHDTPVTVPPAASSEGK